jgi:hypothetical protein
VSEALDDGAVRRRGLRWILAAIVLTVLVIVLLMALRPAAGAYPLWQRVLIEALYAAAVVLLGGGLFGLLAGAPGSGVLSLARVPLKIAIVLAGLAVGGVGELVLHTSLTFQGDRDAPPVDHEHHWDWD